jgi:predicted DNA-binding transcriptional regulator YafY
MIRLKEDRIGPLSTEISGEVSGMYHPTGRVLTVLELLQSRPGLTGPELAARLETDVRTVRRYISKLQDVGIPVEGTPGCFGGYRLRAGYKLPPLIFSEEEATAIVLGLLGSSWLEIGQSPAAVEGALSKITRVLPQGSRERVRAISSLLILSPYREEARPDASLLILLSESIQARLCVHITYRSESEELTRRVVEPYGLVGRRGRWYLVGYCRLRKDYRTFRLDRMRKTLPLEERFQKNEKFDFRAYAAEYLENTKYKWQVKVVFDAELSRIRKRVPASYGTLTRVEDGVAFDWSTDDLDYGARYLMGLRLPFVVREPFELRDALRRLAGEAGRIADIG